MVDVTSLPSKDTMNGGPLYAAVLDGSAAKRLDFANWFQLTSTGVVSVWGNAGPTGAIPGSGSLRASGRADGSGSGLFTAITTWYPLNYRAAQFVRQIAGSDAEIGTINVTDGAVTYGSISDYRRKSEPRKIVGAIEHFRKMLPCEFDWKHDGSTEWGWIAHILQEVNPRAVVGEKDAEQEVGTATAPPIEGGAGKRTTIENVSADQCPDGWTWKKTGVAPVYQHVDPAKNVAPVAAALAEALDMIDAQAATMAAQAEMIAKLVARLDAAGIA